MPTYDPSIDNSPVTRIISTNADGSPNYTSGGGGGGGTVTQGTAAALNAGWPVTNGEATDVTGTFTNATQTTSVTANNLDGYGNALISINGTYANATAVFEGSDDGGTTWYSVDAAQTSGNMIQGGYTNLTNINQTWQINVPGFDSLRVRSTAVTSGTVNVRISPSAGIGSDSAAVGAVDSFQFPTLTTATWGTGTALNTTLAQSSAGYGTALVSTVETGTTTTAGALTFEGFDGTNWWPITGQQVGSFTLQSSYTLVNGTSIAWQFDVAGFQQFQVLLSTAITGTGTPQVVVNLQMMAAPNDIAPTVGIGQRFDQINDAITNYPFGNSMQNITTNATTTLKSGAGVFKGFTVNNNGFTTAGTITIFDNTAASGTKLATITIPISPPGTALLATDLMPPVLGLDGAFSTGLTFVTATTAPAADITVIWR